MRKMSTAQTLRKLLRYDVKQQIYHEFVLLQRSQTNHHPCLHKVVVVYTKSQHSAPAAAFGPNHPRALQPDSLQKNANIWCTVTRKTTSPNILYNTSSFFYYTTTPLPSKKTNLSNNQPTNHLQRF